MGYFDLSQTLSDLVSVNSVNPACSGGRTEEGIQEYVKAFFRASGVPAFEQMVLPGRANTISSLSGRDG